MTEEKFEEWAIIELFGHQRIAGKVSEQTIAGHGFIRVDVPETDEVPAFTRMFGAGAIYGINPVDERTARYTALQIQATPVSVYNIQAHAERMREALPYDDSDEQGEPWPGE